MFFSSIKVDVLNVRIKFMEQSDFDLENSELGSAFGLIFW